jgi:hypothetical protein
MENTEKEIEIALLYNMQLITEHSNNVVNDINDLTLEIQQIL